MTQVRHLCFVPKSAALLWPTVTQIYATDQRTTCVTVCLPDKQGKCPLISKSAPSLRMASHTHHHSHCFIWYTHCTMAGGGGSGEQALPGLLDHLPGDKGRHARVQVPLLQDSITGNS